MYLSSWYNLYKSKDDRICNKSFAPMIINARCISGADWPVGLSGWGPKGPLQQGFPWAPSVLEEKYFKWFIFDELVTKRPVSINENWFKGPVIILLTVIFVCQTVENVKRFHVGKFSR